MNKKELNEKYYKDELLQKCEKNIIDIKTTIVNDKNKYFTLIMSGIKKYFLSINKYLHLFCDAVEITTPKIVNNGEKIKLIYGISINGYEIKSKDREENKTHPLKYSLSEGDKNALSLSFFLAKLDLLNDIDKYIIVIDDPLTSFDTFRKNTTIRQLVGISKKVNQVFLFTHDLNFAKELCDNLNKDETQLLEIKQANSGNYIDIGNGDNLYLNITSYFNVLNSFSYNPSSYNDLIVVGRNIRPCIEGIIKIKYSDVIESNFLLGQIIDKIRNSSEKSPLNKLKNYVEELDDIRCYSNHFHHDKGLDAGFTIEPDELLKYVNRTINLYRSI